MINYVNGALVIMFNYVLMRALDLRKAPRTDLTNTSLSSHIFYAVLGANFPSVKNHNSSAEINVHDDKINQL